MDGGNGPIDPLSSEYVSGVRQKRPPRLTHGIPQLGHSAAAVSPDRRKRLCGVLRMRQLPKVF